MVRILQNSLFFYLFLCVGYLSNAQVRIGPEAGVNLGLQRSVINSNDVSTRRSSTLKAGAIGGVNVDISILRNLYVQTGLFYNYDNIKFKDQKFFPENNLGNYKSEIHDDIHYIKLPLYLMYKSGFDGSGRFMAGVGPYLSYAFIANRATSIPTLDTSGTAVLVMKTNEQLSLGNKATDDLRNWDYGLNACIGYESNVGLFFRGTFNWGLKNLYPMGSSDMKLQNWGAAITIGVNIGRDSW
jgi:hypothetical protein